ncbi:MAG: AI-2E family transporter [Gammaproteobacteria bacterium]
METRDGRVKAFSRWLLAAAAVVIIIAGMRAASDIIVLFLLALSIAIICLPLLAWLHRVHVPTTIAVAILIVIIIIAILGIGAIIGNSVRQIVHDLPTYQSHFQHILQETMQFAHKLGWNGSVKSLRHQINMGNASGLLTGFIKGFGGVVGDVFLIMLTLVFLLFEASAVPRKVASMSKKDQRHGSLEIFSSFVDSVQHYVFLKTVISLMLGVLVGLVLWGVGVRYALLWALLAFLLNFIPNIGAFLSAIPPVLLALLQGGWPMFGYAAGSLFVIHFATGNILEPVLFGERLGLSTLVVWVSLIVWGWVLGPIGMLLSVPLTMIIRIGFDTYPETRWLAVMLGPAPRPENENRLFVRLRRKVFGASPHE